MIPPAQGHWKIKVDAAVSRNSNDGSYGAVCRDDTGKYADASAVRCTGISDPATLEALAIREALTLAQDLSISHVIIASDCRGMMADIKRGSGGMYAAVMK